MAAAYAAAALVAASGLSWSDVLGADKAIPTCNSFPDAVLLAMAAAKSEFMDTHDWEFCRSLERLLYRGHQLTAAQQRRLREIVTC